MPAFPDRAAPSPAGPTSLAGIATLLALVLCFWGALGPEAARAQEEPLGTSTFEGSTEVTLIEVPVNVVDRNGEPIRGLGKDDFRLEDNRKRQTIEAVEVVDLETLRPTRAQVKSTVERLPSVSRRHFLLLFDLTFSRPGKILEAREAARDFVLNHLHPTDLAAVATLSLETGPNLVVTFTPDRAQLARAIDTLGAPDLLRKGQIADPLRFVIEPPTEIGIESEDGLDSAGPDGANLDEGLTAYLSVLAVGQERARQAYERGRITAWSRALSSTARALAAIDGRKHVIYFSEGFDGSLLFGRDASRPNSRADIDQRRREIGQLWLVDQDNTFGNSSLQNDITEMIEVFRRSDCLIQAVDIGGLRVDTDIAGMSGNSVQTRMNDAQDALFYIADGTGGSLFEDANDLGHQLQKVLGRNSVTYVLSYYPTHLEHDGSYHRLEVKADLPRGARISHRAGYYAPKAYADLHPMEKALIAAEAIASPQPRREIELDLLAAPFRASESRAYVPVILELGGRSLLEGHQGDALDLEIYIYATNSRGEMRDFVTQIVGFDLRKVRSGLRETGVKYYGHLDLDPGDYLLRVMVRNGETGRTAVASQPLEVPDYSQRPTDLLPPFFLEPPNRWFMVREKAEDDSGEVIYPFTLAGEPFIPSARARLAAGEAARLAVIGYHLGDGPLELEGRVLADDGQALVGGSLQVIERTATRAEGIDKLIASFDPRDLAAGEYTLEVVVTHLDTGSSRKETVPFVVR